MRRATFDAAMVAALKDSLITGENQRLPEGGILLWNAFMEISKSRAYHDGFPQALTYAEIGGWCRLMRTPLDPHHVQTIRALDDAWVNFAMARHGASKDGGQAPQPPSRQPLTTHMFDAMFS